MVSPISQYTQFIEHFLGKSNTSIPTLTPNLRERKGSATNRQLISLSLDNASNCKSFFSETSKLKPIKLNQKIALAITIFFGCLSILTAIILPYISAIKSFLGFYVIILLVPLITGGCISMLGGVLISRKTDLARTFIFIGGCLGIVNLGALFALPFLKGEQKISTFRGFWILPVICSYLMLVVYITDTPDQQWIPINWRGRNGLKIGRASCRERV